VDRKIYSDGRRGRNESCGAGGYDVQSSRWRAMRGVNNGRRLTNGHWRRPSHRPSALSPADSSTSADLGRVSRSSCCSILYVSSGSVYSVAPPGSKPFQNSCHFQNWNTALRRLAACGNKAEHGCTTTIPFRSSDIKVISAFECVDGEVA